MRADDFRDDVFMAHQRSSHFLRVQIPQRGRPLDVGEQERHDAARERLDDGAGTSGRHCVGTVPRRVEGRILGQDLVLEFDELGTGLEPELGGEHLARFTDGGERVCLLAAAVARNDELRPVRLMERVRGDELFKVRECVAMPARVQERRRSQLVREDVHTGPLTRTFIGPSLSGELVQWGPAPPSERLVEQCQPLVSALDGGRSRDRGLEAARVQRVGIEIEDVSARAVHEGRTVRTEQLSQLRHVRLHGRFRAPRRRVAPERLHDPVQRLGLSGVGEEIREQPPALCALYLDRFAI